MKLTQSGRKLVPSVNLMVNLDELVGKSTYPSSFSLRIEIKDQIHSYEISGYGRKLMPLRSWVQIPVLYTG